MSLEPAVLHTERLLLRPLRQEDAGDLFELLRDEEVAFFVRRGPVIRAEIQEAVREHLRNPWEAHPTFVVVLEERVVGEVTLEIEPRDLTANLGYAIAREHWGKGLATEAARTVVDYGFRVCGLAKVHARADPRNVGSVRVLEKLGMRREGLLRSHVLRRGERADRVLYGLLREEWRAP